MFRSLFNLTKNVKFHIFGKIDVRESAFETVERWSGHNRIWESIPYFDHTDTEEKFAAIFCSVDILMAEGQRISLAFLQCVRIPDYQCCDGSENL